MITQCKFSDSVKFFEKAFIARWNLQPYFNNKDSCLFFGIYTKEDIKFVKQHKGLKIIRDTHGNRFDIYKYFIGDNNIIINAKLEYPNIKKHINNLNINTTRIPVKDFSMFKPNKLGNKIYCYLGHDNQKELYGYSMLKIIQKEIDWEIISATNDYSIEYIKENFYDKSFINLNLHKSGACGLTTATELAYMGRYTIGNTLVKETHIIPYTTIDRLLETIYEASRRIYETPICLIPKNMFIETDEWKHEEFWYEK